MATSEHAKPRTALITGASSGIGAETVRALSGAGWSVHAVARRAERLDALGAETGCAAHAADARDHGAMADILAAAEPDLIVANAGRGGAMTGLSGAAPDEIEAVVATNVTAMLQLFAAALPGMATRGAGHLIAVGSVAGVYATGGALYGGTKAAVRNICRNLRLETVGDNIRVTDIQPGRVVTEFYDAAVPDAAARARLTDTGIQELTVRDVAGAILWAASQPAHVNVSAIEIAPTAQAFGGVRFAGGDRA